MTQTVRILSLFLAAALLLAGCSTQTKEKIGDAAGQAKEKLYDAMEIDDEQAQRIDDTTSQAKEKLSDAAGQAKEKLYETIGVDDEQAQDWIDDTTGWAREKLNDVLTKAGGKIVDALDRLENAEYQGGPFENNEESARAYLLDQLAGKYGREFIVTGREDLHNYGALAGATYRCEAAPADAPEQVFRALVSQSRYRKVLDNYPVWFYKEEAEAPVVEFCRQFDYVLDQRVSLEMPGTTVTWTGEDNLRFFLRNSGAYVKIVLRLEDDRDVDFYAAQLQDFLSRVTELDCNVLIQARANKTYLYHREFSILDGANPATIPLEKIREDVEIMMKTGGPLTEEELAAQRAQKEAAEQAEAGEQAEAQEKTEDEQDGSATD